jgi:hypothetical protein
VTRAGEYLGIIGFAIGESIKSLVSPRPADMARKIAGQPILSLRVIPERIEITPIGARFRSNSALSAIVQAVSHLEPSGMTYRAYSERERRNWRSYGYGEMLGRGHPIWSSPITYERQYPGQDIAAFDALCGKLAQFDRAISLPELREASESAYLSTRPADFDLHYYYA